MNYRIVNNLFTPIERVLLLGMGDLTPGWVPGRQGTGYERAPVQFDELEARCLKELGVPPETGHDAYLIRYREGAFIPPHKDDAPFGTEHRRINILLSHAEEGGVLRFDGEVIELDELDAIVFRPDLVLHEVSPVTKGQRVLWTVGVLV